jgi:hypothetical protein
VCEPLSDKAKLFVDLVTAFFGVATVLDAGSGGSKECVDEPLLLVSGCCLGFKLMSVIVTRWFRALSALSFSNQEKSQIYISNIYKFYRKQG